MPIPLRISSLENSGRLLRDGECAGVGEKGEDGGGGRAAVSLLNYTYYEERNTALAPERHRWRGSSSSLKAAVKLKGRLKTKKGGGGKEKNRRVSQEGICERSNSLF